MESIEQVRDHTNLETRAAARRPWGLNVVAAMAGRALMGSPHAWGPDQRRTTYWILVVSRMAACTVQSKPYPRLAGAAPGLQA
jgi:hypothetical protein